MSLRATYGLSSVYGPQTDGQSETTSHKAEEMKRAFASLKRNNWSEHLIDIMNAPNKILNRTTQYTSLLITYKTEP